MNDRQLRIFNRLLHHMANDKGFQEQFQSCIDMTLGPWRYIPDNTRWERRTMMGETPLDHKYWADKEAEKPYVDEYLREHNYVLVDAQEN